MAKVSAATLIAWLTFTSLGISQNSASAAHTTPKFDAASVMECSPTDKAAQSRTYASGLSLGCWSLRTLIQQAYDVFASGKLDTLNPGGFPTMQIEGLPNWADSSPYSIEAKAGAPQTAAMMRGPMMQALLEERFHLKLHREEREVPVYRMSVAPGRVKLHETKEGTCAAYDFSEALNMAPSGQVFCGVPTINRRGPLTILDVHGITLRAFARSLHPDGLPVIDATGLNGKFDIHLEWGFDVLQRPAGAAGVAGDPSPHASATDALREELGLRLTRDKAMSEFLVIDHIEKAAPNN